MGVDHPLTLAGALSIPDIGRRRPADDPVVARAADQDVFGPAGQDVVPGTAPEDLPQPFGAGDQPVVSDEGVAFLFFAGDEDVVPGPAEDVAVGVVARSSPGPR